MSISTSTTKKGKVLVAMSGGVDSSVAAALLQREGYEVVGCFMRLGSPGESLDRLEPVESVPAVCDPAKIRIGHQGCCSINDAADARLVASRLGIPFYVCNFKKDFGRIIDYFVDEYNAGRTPNPCVRCNTWLKFGKLHEYARQIDAPFVASGHYARIGWDGQGAQLLRGIDGKKDQSYVLFGVPRGRIGEMLLPIGQYTKPEIRSIAREFDLPVSDKPDSQEICFVPDNDYAGLVRRRTPEAIHAGAILDPEGRTIGEHPGHQHFTIGQRRGVGVALGYPIFVIDRDPEANTIMVGPRERLACTSCTANEVNWLSEDDGSGDDINEEGLPCLAQVRYNSAAHPATLHRVGADEISVEFDNPVGAVAPGQAVVCYDSETDQRVMAGGWIQSVQRASTHTPGGT